MTSHDGGDWNGCPNCGGTWGDTIERVARAMHASTGSALRWEHEWVDKPIYQNMARAAVAAMPIPAAQEAHTATNGPGVVEDSGEGAAEALREIAERYFYDGDHDRPLPGYDELMDIAARSGGTR